MPTFGRLVFRDSDPLAFAAALGVAVLLASPPSRAQCTDCASTDEHSTLLFPLVSNAAARDTVIVLDAVSPGKSTSCAFEFYPAGGGNPIAWQTPCFPAGQQYAFSLTNGGTGVGSYPATPLPPQLSSGGFTGYAIGRCQGLAAASAALTTQATNPMLAELDAFVIDDNRATELQQLQAPATTVRQVLPWIRFGAAVQWGGAGITIANTSLDVGGSAPAAPANVTVHFIDNTGLEVLTEQVDNLPAGRSAMLVEPSSSGPFDGYVVVESDNPLVHAWALEQSYWNDASFPPDTTAGDGGYHGVAAGFVPPDQPRTMVFPFVFDSAAPGSSGFSTALVVDNLSAQLNTITVTFLAGGSAPAPSVCQLDPGQRLEISLYSTCAAIPPGFLGMVAIQSTRAASAAGLLKFGQTTSAGDTDVSTASLAFTDLTAPAATSKLLFPQLWAKGTSPATVNGDWAVVLGNASGLASPAQSGGAQVSYLGAGAPLPFGSPLLDPGAALLYALTAGTDLGGNAVAAPAPSLEGFALVRAPFPLVGFSALIDQQGIAYLNGAAAQALDPQRNYFGDPGALSYSGTVYAYTDSASGGVSPSIGTLAGVAVQLCDPAMSCLYAVTAADGSYTLPVPGPGQYTLSVQSDLATAQTDSATFTAQSAPNSTLLAGYALTGQPRGQAAACGFEQVDFVFHPAPAVAGSPAPCKLPSWVWAQTPIAQWPPDARFVFGARTLDAAAARAILQQGRTADPFVSLEQETIAAILNVASGVPASAAELGELGYARSLLAANPAQLYQTLSQYAGGGSSGGGGSGPGLCGGIPAAPAPLATACGGTP